MAGLQELGDLDKLMMALLMNVLMRRFPCSTNIYMFAKHMMQYNFLQTVSCSRKTAIVNLNIVENNASEKKKNLKRLHVI